MKTKAFLFSLFFSILGCIGNNSKKNNPSITSNQEKNDTISIADSLIEIKYQLKESIFEQYSKIPLSIFESNDGVDHSKYEEFIEMDSLINKYEDYSLSDREKQLLAILKFKKHLLLSNYTEAIKELEILPDDLETENYKNLLLGIAYNLKGDSLDSEKHFKELLAKFETSDQNASDCKKYILIKVLSESKEIHICKDYLTVYEGMKVEGKIELIKDYVLTDLEL